MATDTRVHGVLARKGGDQAFFIATFLIGTVGILATKGGSLPVIAAALIPVAVLCLYAIGSWYFHRAHLEPDLTGDNCYYLGFMFTLVSLAWTLYAVANAGEQRNNAVVLQIISGFGVALASTICGIFLRALFLQLRPDPVSSERKARKDILDAARDLRTELSQSVKELKGFTTEVHQQTEEHRAKVDKATEDALSAHQTWMKRYARDTAELVADVHRASIEKVIATMDEGARDAATQIRGNMEATAVSLQTALGGVTQRLAAAAAEIDNQGNAVSSAVTGLGDRVAIAANALQLAIAGAADRVRGAGDTIATSTQGVDSELKAYITMMAQSREQLGSSLDGVGKAVYTGLNKASSQLARIGKLMDPRLAEIEARFEQTSLLARTAAEELGNAARASTEVALALEDVRRRISAFEQLPDPANAKVIADELVRATLAVNRLAKELQRLPEPVIMETQSSGTDSSTTPPAPQGPEARDTLNPPSRFPFFGRPR